MGENMSVDKINATLPVTKSLSFKGDEVSIPKEVEVDEEKSSSMSKKIGLCAAAAIAIGGIILYARRGKVSKTPTSVTTAGGGGRPQQLLQRLLRRLVPVRLCLSL